MGTSKANSGDRIVGRSLAAKLALAFFLLAAPSFSETGKATAPAKKRKPAAAASKKKPGAKVDRKPAAGSRAVAAPKTAPAKAGVRGEKRLPANDLATSPAPAATPSAPVTPPPAAAKPKPAADEGDQQVYSYKINSHLGFLLANTTAVTLGTQFGFAVSKPSPFFVGPEVSYSLFSDGRVLSILAGGWYELRLTGSPRFAVHVGGLGGVGLTSNLPGEGKTIFVGYLDTALSQDVDDLVTIRGQFRPGVVGSSFAFAMNFSVSFRFL